MDWTHETRLKRSKKAVWRAFGGETAIIMPGSSSIRTLNQVGARIWELADDRPLVEIVDCLVNEFDVDRNQLEQDVAAFLNELAARDLLEVTT